MAPDDNAGGGQQGAGQQGAGQQGAGQQGAGQQGAGQFDVVFGGLAETDRRYAEAKGWPKIGMAGIIEAHRNLETKVGVDTIKLPGKDAKPEDLDKFYNVLGRPEKAEAYELKPANGVEVDKDLEGWFRTTGHKRRLTQAQAAGLYEDWNALQAEAKAAFVQESDKAFARLKADKGADFDAFGAAARQAVDMFVPKGQDGRPDSAVLDQMEKTLKTGPLFEIWGNIGMAIANFGTLDGMGGAAGMALTPQAALAEINKIIAERAENAKHPLNDNRHPGYKDAAQRWAKLHQIAYPDTGGVRI